MPDSPPRVSAIVTAYDVATYLGEALDSVLGQTHPVAEVVVVDDGSSDATPDVARAYHHDGVRLIRQKNQGPGAARNRGLDETTGEFVAFLDGDDVWLPHKTASQLRLFAAQPSLDLISGDKIWWDLEDATKRRVVPYGRPPKAWLRREIVFRNCIGNPSMVMVRRSVLDQLGRFDAGQHWGEDWELWMRIAAVAEVGFVGAPVVIYRWHPQNITRRADAWARLDDLYRLSVREIRRSLPAWRRPMALLRAFGQTELQRAQLTTRHDRTRHLRHALMALLSDPRRDTVAKGKELARALLGVERCRLITRRLSRPDRAARSDLDLADPMDWSPD